MYLFPKGGKTWHIVKETKRTPEEPMATYITLCSRQYPAFLVRVTEYRDHMYPLCKSCDRSTLADAIIEGE